MTAREQAERFLRGERETIDAIRTRIELVIRRFRHHRRGPADLAQDALGRLYLSLAAGRFRGTSSLETYAEQIAKHVCLEELRRQRITAPLEIDQLQSRERWASPEGALLADEAHQQELRVLASVSAPCLELFRLIFLENLSYDEVAQRLGISDGALRVRLHRCRQQIAEHARRRRATHAERKIGKSP